MRRLAGQARRHARRHALRRALRLALRRTLAVAAVALALALGASYAGVDGEFFALAAFVVGMALGRAWTKGE